MIKIPNEQGSEGGLGPPRYHHPQVHAKCQALTSAGTLHGGTSALGAPHPGPLCQLPGDHASPPHVREAPQHGRTLERLSEKKNRMRAGNKQTPSLRDCLIEFFKTTIWGTGVHSTTKPVRWLPTPLGEKLRRGARMPRESKGPGGRSMPPRGQEAPGQGPPTGFLSTNLMGVLSSGEPGTKHSIHFFWQQPRITVW